MSFQAIKSFANEKMTQFLTHEQRATLLMKLFGLTQVPLLFAVRPKVIELSDTRCVVCLPFKRRVKNHLGSVYFGAQAIGADTCVGMLAMDKIQKSQKNISLVFKDFKANFIKRAVGEMLFICDDGKAITELVNEVIETKERRHKTIKAHGRVHGEIVSEFELTLSLKEKSQN